jgi:mannitol/fructose-specific phosphotransferase system IIA component (Ntr-type)
MSALLLKSTSADLMMCRVEAADQAGVIRAMARQLAAFDAGVDPLQVEQVALAREEIESTGIGGRVALPHARTDAVHSTRLCIATLAAPVEWDSYDDKPVEVVFMILGSRRAPAHQLRVLADVSGLVRQRGFVDRLLEAADSIAMYEAVRSALVRAD